MSEQGQDMMALLQRMQQQMTYLEKKLDTLIQNSQQKPFNRDRNFSRPPFRPFGRPRRPGEHGPGGFDRGQAGQQGGPFAPKKKPFFGRRDKHS